MDILNLVKTALCAILMCTIFKSNALSDSLSDFKTSFFPMIPGSYWVTQDTFFIHEDEIAAQEGGMNPFTIKTDSVMQVVRLNDSTKISMMSRVGSAKTSGTCYEYVLNKNSLVTKTSIDNKPIKITAPRWKLFPEKGDTVFESGSIKYPLVYDSIVNKDTIYLYPKWESKNPASVPSMYKFVRGIGLVGRIGTTTANRLIEYRIGNGPIVKKRWIMKKPEEK